MKSALTFWSHRSLGIAYPHEIGACQYIDEMVNASTGATSGKQISEVVRLRYGGGC